jgi:response regulator RpfG family c-di-GMP phosphodiesterase
MTRSAILVVEDEAITAKDLQATLEDLGYEVCGTASSGAEAVQKAEADRPDLVLMDIVLQGEMDGIEAAQQIRANWDIPVVYLTAHSDMETIRRASITEPYGYIVKPFTERELHSNIEISLYKSRMDRMYRDSCERIEKNLQGTIDCISELIRTRDPFLNRHQKKVTSLSCAIAEETGLPADKLEGVRVGSLVHALGLMIVPAEMLAPAGTLSGDRLRMYQEYPKIGFDLLKGIDFPWPVAQIVLQHRELRDGSGFPFGLKGEAIIQEARIVGLAHAVVSMLAGPNGRPGVTSNEMLAQILRDKGVLYDSLAVDACIRLFREKGFALGD